MNVDFIIYSIAYEFPTNFTLQIVVQVQHKSLIKLQKKDEKTSAPDIRKEVNDFLATRIKIRFKFEFRSAGLFVL
jgi:nuclear transport factor 2 (NTF2) superfamily protein